MAQLYIKTYLYIEHKKLCFLYIFYLNKFSNMHFDDL